MEKVELNLWVMYQCVLNITLWSDWRKLTYSQPPGSAVLKTLSLQSF